ncbi:MAG TPA: type VI secretion system baseplate subunit TssK [Tepidisphaeraceae bacterium]|jgi:predicted component of type VI protein secretion system|nr:type VI secretion system baseplate subunit TssK [Tepidisphaeraceae bacterium]
MTEDEIMHWENGLFVEPQHFQTMQRQTIQRHVAERRLLTPFPYGVVSAQIDKETLSLSGGLRVKFKELHVVMESGLVVQQGVNATVEDLDFKDFTGGGTFTIYLLVRAWDPTQRVISDAEDGESIGNGRHAVTRYKRKWVSVPDENTGGTDDTKIPTRLIDARLIAVGPGDSKPDRTWEAMPLLQITASVPPLVKPDYAPPCFRLSGSDGLKNLVKLIDLRVAARLSFLSALSLPEKPSRIDMETLVKFQSMTMNRAALSHALRSDSLSAYEAYGLCLQLYAGLKGADISPDSVVSNYVHDNPWPAFQALFEMIIAATPESVERWRRFELTPVGPSNPYVQSCQPDLELVAQGWTCVLAVAADSAKNLDVVMIAKNIRVGSPLGLMYLEPGQFIGWKEVQEVVEPIHAPGGHTRFLLLNINQESPAWKAVMHVRTIGVRYADQTGAVPVQLSFRLYMKPPASAARG